MRSEVLVFEFPICFVLLVCNLSYWFMNYSLFTKRILKAVNNKSEMKSIDGF
jgi:hypothetical protein